MHNKNYIFTVSSVLPLANATRMFAAHQGFLGIWPNAMEFHGSKEECDMLRAFHEGWFACMSNTANENMERELSGK